MGGKPLIRHR